MHFNDGLPRTCARCARDFIPGHPAARYCSLSCKYAARDTRRRRSRPRFMEQPTSEDKVNLNIKTCCSPPCKRSFYSESLAAMYCSETCRQRAANRRRKKRNSSRRIAH
jgi:hypothetical protein